MKDDPRIQSYQLNLMIARHALAQLLVIPLQEMKSDQDRADVNVWFMDPTLAMDADKQKAFAFDQRLTTIALDAQMKFRALIEEQGGDPDLELPQTMAALGMLRVQQGETT